MKNPSAVAGRALIVDDSRLVRAVVARSLKSAGYETEEASDGADALKRLARESFDVVISDLRMPHLNGLELLAAVKRLSPDVEVIILTGTHSQDMTCAIQALRLGAHDYLTKPPSSAEEVVLTVQRAVEKKRLKDANKRLLHELESLSRTDALTGVANRRAFDEALPREIARARRQRDGLGVVMLDIDHFKNINDTHGHQGGDEILASLARVVGSVLREGDQVYRYGGEEFVVILPCADERGVLQAAERIVAAVAAAPMRVGKTSIPVTTSAGAASLMSSDKSGESLIGRADAAVYEAKHTGRNRACCQPSRPFSLVSRAS